MLVISPQAGRAGGNRDRSRQSDLSSPSCWSASTASPTHTKVLSGSSATPKLANALAVWSCAFSTDLSSTVIVTIAASLLTCRGAQSLMPLCKAGLRLICNAHCSSFYNAHQRMGGWSSAEQWSAVDALLGRPFRQSWQAGVCSLVWCKAQQTSRARPLPCQLAAADQAAPGSLQRAKKVATPALRPADQVQAGHMLTL